MVEQAQSKLVIIRGPSGAGKSTVSRELFERCTRPTLLVSEDQVRKTFSDHHLPGHEASKKLATATVLMGLENGYDVVYEGILNLKTSGNNLQEILKAHSEDSYLFYLDVGFDESLRRHQTRPEKTEFDAEAMERWWDYASPTDHPAESVIPESSSIEETIKTIGQVASLSLRAPE